MNPPPVRAQPGVRPRSRLSISTAFDVMK